MLTFNSNRIVLSLLMYVTSVNSSYTLRVESVVYFARVKMIWIYVASDFYSFRFSPIINVSNNKQLLRVVQSKVWGLNFWSRIDGALCAEFVRIQSLIWRCSRTSLTGQTTTDPEDFHQMQNIQPFPSF